MNHMTLFLNSPSTPSVPTQNATFVVTTTDPRAHCYRPFRRLQPARPQTTAHDIIARILTQEEIPPGTFLSREPKKGPVSHPKTIRRSYGSNNKPTGFDLRVSIPSSLSCYSSSSEGAVPPPVPAKDSIYRKLPRPAVDSVPASPNQELDVIHPVFLLEDNGQALEFPLGIPVTPLDIPVDWDDLREKWVNPDSPVEAFPFETKRYPKPPADSSGIGNSPHFKGDRAYLIEPLRLAMPLQLPTNREKSPSPYPITSSKTENVTQTYTKRDLKAANFKAEQSDANAIRRNRGGGTKRRRRHGKFVSLDEAELLLRTVKFSSTLDLGIDDTLAQDAALGESFLSIGSPTSPQGSRRWTAAQFAAIRGGTD